MRFGLLFLILISLWNLSYAQDPDSVLLAQLDTAQTTTSKLAILYQLAQKNFGNHPKKTKAYSWQGLAILKKEKKSDSTHLANTAAMNLTAGLGSYFIAQYDSAIWYYKRSLALMDSIPNYPLSQKAKVLSNMGVAYTYTHGELTNAAKCHLEALKIREELDDPKLGASLNNLGLVYEHMNDLHKALSYYRRSATVKKAKGQLHQLPNSLNNISRIYEDFWQMDSAIYYQKQALALAKELNHKEMTSNSYGTLSNIYIKSHQYQTGLSYAKQNYKLKKELGNRHHTINALHWMARANLGLERKQEAKRLLDEAASLGVDSSILDIHYGHLGTYYLLSEQFDSAGHYFKLKQGIISSKKQAVINRQIRELETQYETEKKQRQIELLNKDNELQAAKLKSQQQQFWLLGIVATLLLALLIALAVMYHYRTKTNQQLKELNATKDKLFAVIAHDLKNPLSAFRSITQSLSNNLFDIQKEDISYFLNKLNKSSDQLYELLQNLLQWAISQTGNLIVQPKQISLQTVISDVFALLQLNAEERKIDLSYDIPEGMKVYADEKMLKTILRNLVSNALKFTNRKGQVSIKAKYKYKDQINTVQISVLDTGIGMSKADQQKLFKIDTDYSQIGTSKNKGTGLGLILCKELVEKHGGNIWVESELNKGTIFNFTLHEKPFA